MTDTKKPKVPVKTVPAKKQVKTPGVVVKPQKVTILKTIEKVSKPTPKKPVAAIVKPKATPAAAPVKKTVPKNIQTQNESPINKIMVQKSEVSSFMHEMQSQAL